MFTSVVDSFVVALWGLFYGHYDLKQQIRYLYWRGNQGSGNVNLE